MQAAWIWLAVLAAGIAAFLYGGTRDMRSPLAEPLVYSGIALVAVALVMLFLTWRASRRRAYAAAAGSTDAIARWQVYPSDMAAFRQVDEARAGRLWSLKNSLNFPAQVPPEGIPVVIGEKSLLVGDKFWPLGLEELGTAGDVLLVDGNPGFLEISSRLETTKAPLIVVMRIPVPAAARQEAIRAAAHLDSQVKPQDRERLRSTFGDHFEAVGQQTDAPHRMQRRRKVVIPVLALFILALAGFLLYSFLLAPRTSTYPDFANETTLPPANDTLPAPSTQ
jgi:hypothetical protein